MDWKIQRKQYGIREDMTAVIQAAIEKCTDSGGGRVMLSEGIYVCGTLQLKNHVTLWLEKGAMLLGSDEIEAYPDNESCFTDAVGQVRGKAFIYAWKQKKIGIGGPGIVNGRGGKFGEEHPAHLIRPFLVRLVGCSEVQIEETIFREAAAWCLHIQNCDQVRIRNVSILSRCNGNNDGIDIDGCRDVEIIDCHIDSGDDAICLKTTSGRPCSGIRISGCTVTSGWAGFKIGTESVGDFTDICLEDCRFYDIEGCAIKLVPVDGANVERVKIQRVRMINCTGPIFISNGERLNQYFSAKRDKPGTIRQLVLKEIEADVKKAEGRTYQGKLWGNAMGCVVLSGLAGNPIRDVFIQGCRFWMPGGAKEQYQREVPEMGNQYPEFHLFDPLPAWGLYQRNTEKIQLAEDTVFIEKEKDVRPVCVTVQTALSTRQD